MKILYIIHDTIMAGSTISFINMVFGLHEKGIIPIVVYPENSTEMYAINLFQTNNMQCFSAPIALSFWTPFSIISKKPRKIISNLLRLKNIIKNIRNQQIKSLEKLSDIVQTVHPDIIHTNTGVVHEGYKVAGKYGIPHIWHLREYQDFDFGWHIYPLKQFFIKELKKSTAVITITNDIKRHFDLDRTKNAHTIYNGILPEKDTVFVQQKDKYFLCASRISKEKCIDEVIFAFAKFCETYEKYKLIIAGFGSNDYINELKTLAEILNCSDKIDFTGYREKEEVLMLMQNATALIVASKYEGFGRMTAEAAFCGCLVIGRNSAGTKEIIEYTNGGFLYSSQNELIANLIKAANLKTKQYKNTILPAQMKAKSAFSIEQNTENIYSLYRDIVNNDNCIKK